MNMVDALLAQAQHYHVRLSAAGDRLRWRAPDDPPLDFLERLRELKPEVIKALTRNEPKVLSHWWKCIALMHQSNAPHDYPPERWDALCEAAVAFNCDAQAGQAVRLGWSELDLWGAHARKPFGAIYCAGLVMFLPAKIVGSIAADAIVLNRDSSDSASTKFYRQRATGYDFTVPTWSLCRTRQESS